MFVSFRDIAGLGIMGSFVIAFLVIFGAFAWPVLLGWLFLTWLSIKFCR